MATQTSAVTTNFYDTAGHVRVTWTNADKLSTFHSWGVWRRTRNEYDTDYSAWELIYETTIDKATYVFFDYLAPANRLSQYVVRQRTQVNAVLTWDSANENQRSVTPEGTNYWLIDPNDSANNLLLGHVTSDDFDYEREEEVLELIGRGRKIDRGTMLGVKGSMKVDFRNRQDLVRLIDLWELDTPIWLRNPFGDVWQIALEQPGIGRKAGVGTQEFTDVALSYLEVT